MPESPPSGGSAPRVPPTVRLVPLPGAQLDEYLEPEIRGYADDHVRDGQWSPAEALERSRAEFRELLPQGVDTPDHHLRVVVAGPDNPPVGWLWYALRKDGPAPYLFIYNLTIFEAYRGRGYGEAALRALEPIARALGVARIGLHVFGHNQLAIRLYERVGYRTTNLLMSKPIG